MAAKERCLVLVVEDDPSIAEFVEWVLGDEGYRAVVVATGEAALQQVATERPALILLDMILPGMSGTAFLHALRERYAPGIPVILMTAARDELVQEGVQAEGVLLKPFELDALLGEVERVAGGECVTRDA